MPATGAADKPWVEQIDPGQCFYIGSAQGADVLAFLASRVLAHRAILQAALGPLLADPQRRHTFNLALHHAARVQQCARAGQARFDLEARLPGPSCVPGLSQMAPFTFGDALYQIAWELYDHFPIISQLIRALPDAYDAAELAQALDLARRVCHAAGSDRSAGDFDTETLMQQQFARWSKQWEADPQGEENAIQIRASFPGQTLAQILPRAVVCKPLANAKQRRSKRPARKTAGANHKHA